MKINAWILSGTATAALALIAPLGALGAQERVGQRRQHDLDRLGGAARGTAAW